MTRVRRARGIAAVLATLVAATLATTAQNDAHAATGSRRCGRSEAGEDEAAHPRHRLRPLLHPAPARCEREAERLDLAPQRIGSDHVATFKVRTSRTQGLSFVIRAPWQGNTGAVSNIVTRYAGHSVDTAVSRDAARHGKQARGLLGRHDGRMTSGSTSTSPGSPPRPWTGSPRRSRWPTRRTRCRAGSRR